jgi:hypothetical protein
VVGGEEFGDRRGPAEALGAGSGLRAALGLGLCEQGSDSLDEGFARGGHPAHADDLADAAVRIGDDRRSTRQGFERGEAEGFEGAGGQCYVRRGQ